MDNFPNENNNADIRVISDFGEEWTRFDQSALSDAERNSIFNSYFAIFPWQNIPESAIGFDAGCGTGRWALLVAPRVGHLHCIDPSNAIEMAVKNLSQNENCTFHRATIEFMPLADDSMDFGYSIGVLHHLPDTQKGIRTCVRKLKRGAPFLVYLYYAFDNRPLWFRAVWRVSDLLRRGISRLPGRIKFVVSQIIAAVVYFPFARTSRELDKFGFSIKNFPLSAYKDRSFYTMKTDALDRFGTRLEHRFSKKQIRAMMENSGLRNVRFSSNAPFWCVVGYKD